MNITYKMDKKYHCLSCKEIKVADFGKTLKEAKKNFKKSINLMLSTKLKQIKEIK